jgi:hypothetical protein
MVSRLCRTHMLHCIETPSSRRHAGDLSPRARLRGCNETTDTPVGIVLGRKSRQISGCEAALRVYTVLPRHIL